MYCQSCGKELAPDALTCAACGAPVFRPPPPPPPGAGPSTDPVVQMARDVKNSAKELAASAARLSKRLAEKAEVAAKDPSATAKSAAKKVAEELDAVSKKIDQIVRDL